MLEIENKIIKTISIDFDGVLLELFMGREWAPDVASKQKIGTKIKIPKHIGKYVMRLNLKIRKKMPDVEKALEHIRGKVEKMYLLTSRNNILREDTIEWLKNNHIDIFDEYVFNVPEENSADFKIKEINERNIDLHIDDNLEVSLKIAKECPKCISLNLNDKVANTTNKQVNFYSFACWDDLIGFLK